MTLPLSGNSISLLNLQLEYDDAPPSSLNEFYGKGQAPSSGTIDLADFYQPSSTNAVSSNILFELDARSSSSWSGSGSTWSDISGNNRDFTLYGGPTGATNAVSFDGTNDYGAISEDTWIPEDNDPFTYEAYVSIDDFTNTQFSGDEKCIFSKIGNGQHMLLGFQEISSSELRMIAQAENSGNGNVDRATHYYNMGASSNYEGSYHHFVWTYDGSNLKYYIDGSNVATFTGRRFGDNSDPLRIMTFRDSGSYQMSVGGDVRVLRCYATALSSTNVSTNYSNCTGGIEPVDSVLSVSPNSHQNSAFTLTCTFDQNVGLFDTNDITVTNATKGTFTAVSKKVYTLVLTPTGQSDITVTIPAGASFNAGSLDNNAINKTIPYSTFVLDNLVCFLDATDSTSYNGSGSTWNDISGSGTTYNASLYNTPGFTSSDPQYFTFNGSNSYSEINRPVQDDFSLGVWFRTTVNSGSANQWYNGRGILDGEVSGGANDFGISMGAGRIMFGTGSNDTTLTSTANLNDGEWHYIVATRTKSTGAMQLYVDGSLDASNSSTSNTSSLTAPSKLHMGRMQTGGDYWQGDISQVHIYDDVLTSSEVSTNYNSTVGVYYTPSVSLSTLYHSNAQFTLTFTWNLNVTGFTSSDITVTNASKGTFSGSGKIYTLVLTPSGQSTINVSIPANAVTHDGGSGQNDAFSANIVYATWPEADLLLWYDFDTNALSGTTAINSEGTNGTISHSTYSMVTTDPGYVDFSPQGSGGGITCPTISTSDLNADWTAAFWIKYDTVNQGTWFSNELYFSAGSESTRQMVELSTKEGGLSCAFYEDDHESNGKVGQGVWYYNVYRYDYSTGTIEFISDLANIGSGTAGGTVTVSSNNAPNLAGNPIGLTNDGFDGKISQFQFYDKKLTDEEVGLAYNQHKSAYHGSLPSTPTFAHVAQDYSGSGTTQDASVGSNTITWSNSPTFLGNGWDFDSNEYGTLANSVDNNGNGTFMMWCRPDSSGTLTMFAHRGSGDNGFQFRFDSDGKLQILRHFNASLGKSNTGASLTDGLLFLAGYTRNSNTFTFFVNGSTDGSFTTTDTFSHSTNTIGAAHYGENFRGQIYSWAYWDNTVLSNSNISDIYDIGPTMGLVSY